MRRRVVVFNHYARSPGSPGGTRHIELFSRLHRWDAVVVASSRSLIGGGANRPEGILETVWTTRQGRSGISRVLSWLSYAVGASGKACRLGHVDVVYGSSPHLLAGAAAWLVSKARRAGLVLEVRDVWPRVLSDMGAMSEKSFIYRSLEVLERFLYRRADHIVILAEGVEEHIRSASGTRAPITFVPNGADPEDFRVSADRSTLRERYGFRGVTAVYAGAHGPANGLDLLLEAAAELRDGSFADVQIVLVGDGSEKPRLVATSRSSALENVMFLEPVPKAEIPDLLFAADIGVHCLADVDLFRTGVSPNKVFDYMAAGLPVLTNVPGEVSDYVEEGGAGVTVEATGLGQGLAKLAALTEEERAELGASGRRHLARTRSRAEMARRVEQVLDEVAA